jgi:beta-lactamase superfamily II metal-dependent hydrolase
MFEIDFLSVGDGERSGDAIAARFARADTGGMAHVVIDAGLQGDGAALVEHVKQYYGVGTVDLAILTHPDGDHIGGMGEVVRGLQVAELWLHRIGARGGASLPAAAAVEDLIRVAQGQGTTVAEPWAGDQRFGGALTILGPDKTYYEALVAEQVAEGPPVAKASRAATLLEAARGVFARLTDALGVEIPFAEQDVTPRNNSSIITLLRLDDSILLLTGDAGVPALDRAWTFGESEGWVRPPTFVQVPHHGSRRNCSSAWLDRLLGECGQEEWRTAFVSVVAESPDHPSGKVVNAYKRRGCKVVATTTSTKVHYKGTTGRPGWVAAVPLGAMVEEDD